MLKISLELYISLFLHRDILKRGGNAVDAMIAATLCDGAVCPQSTGLGGGFVMLYYKKADNKVYSVDARETAPGAASENMHHGNSAIAMKGENSQRKYHNKFL